MPFPGGAGAAWECAAYEKGLLEGAGVPAREQPTEPRGPAGHHAPTSRHALISEPDRHSVRWMLAGAGMAVAVAAFLLLLSTGRLSAGFALVLRAIAPS